MILVNAQPVAIEVMPPPIRALAETAPLSTWVHFTFSTRGQEYEAWGGGFTCADAESAFHETYFPMDFNEPYTIVWLGKEDIIVQ